jgi:hypothetical protein
MPHGQQSDLRSRKQAIDGDEQHHHYDAKGGEAHKIRINFSGDS